MTDADLIQCDIRGCVASSSCTLVLRDPWEIVTLCERHAGITQPTESHKDLAAFRASRDQIGDAGAHDSTRGEVRQ